VHRFDFAATSTSARDGNSEDRLRLRSLCAAISGCDRGTLLSRAMREPCHISISRTAIGKISLPIIAGTKQPFPNRKSATLAAIIRGSCRRAGSTNGPAITLRSTAWLILVTSRAPGDKTVRIRLPKTATKPEVENRAQPMLLRAAIK
jgi:hypothetical protein